MVETRNPQKISFKSCWAVLYFYEEPPVPVPVPKINWNYLIPVAHLNWNQEYSSGSGAGSSLVL
jgi:hypothetical protein